MTPSSDSAATPNRLRELAASERPQERALLHGTGALSDVELLALLLRSGTRGQDVLTLAARLLSESGGLPALARWPESEFRRLKGIGRVKAIQLRAVMEVARRVLHAERDQPTVLLDAVAAYAYLRPQAIGLEREQLWVLTLTSRRHLIRRVVLTQGTQNRTLFSLSEILREVVRDGADAFIVAHNHPSGDPAPSREDIRATRELQEASATLHLTLVDHLVLGLPTSDQAAPGYYSFRVAGHLGTMTA